MPAISDLISACSENAEACEGEFAELLLVTRPGHERPHHGGQENKEQKHSVVGQNGNVSPSLLSVCVFYELILSNPTSRT